MKRKISVLATLIFLFATAAKAQIQDSRINKTNVPIVKPVSIFKVTQATIVRDSTRHITSAVSTTNFFKVTINSVGAGTLQCAWVVVNQHDPNIIVTKTLRSLTVNGSGTDTLLISRASVPSVPVIITLQVTSPNTINSNSYTY